jgi:ATP adenylyltransferase
MPEDGSTFAGEPDGFGRLWTPHRMVYIKGEGKPAHDEAGAACPFCSAPTRSDEDALIVARGRLVYAVLNLYPYNSGHLMSVPYRHVAGYPDLDEDETLELAQFTQRAMRVIGTVMAPHGFNLGINQGTAAGAGITGHLHEHVVPRWGGDTNFMPVVGQTRVLPELLADARAALAAAWAATAA